MDFKKVKERLKAVHAFPISPFMPKDRLRLNEDGLRENVGFLIKNGVGTIVPCGGTGENFSLSIEEYKRVIEVVREETGANRLVVPGLQGGLGPTIELARYSEQVGADAVLVFPPSRQASDEGTYRYHEAIAKEIGLGIVLYNTSLMPYGAELIDRLIHIENVVGIKDEVKSVDSFSRMSHLVGEKVVKIFGIDYSAFTAAYYFMAGGEATTCGIVNFAPKYPLELYEAGVKRDWKRVREIERFLAPISELRNRVGHIAVVKEAMDMIGLYGGPVRPPLLPLKKRQKEALRSLLQEIGLDASKAHRQ